MAGAKANVNHIFLTGKIQVGKSTILRSILEDHPDWQLKGFFTKWIRRGPSNKAGLYIFPADRETIFNVQDYLDNIDEDDCPLLDPDLLKSENLLAEFSSDNYKKKCVHTEAFDLWGKKLLSDKKKADLIIMDEIGIFEDGSKDFLKAVTTILNGSTPVMGIVSARKGDVTYAVENSPNVEVIEVTKENRDKLRKDLIKKLK